MTEYSNENRGTLFKNTKKEEDRHPDYNGSINIEGTEYWLNAWIKESKKDGTKFFSLSVKEKQDSPRQSSAPTRKTKTDDDLPF
ncbi:hypothetical protein UFOVP566_49 [uncultured Caudovirales phage]|uniref:DUF736 domain-containing protein n=1 Tax=uncultured Caudovirales phage TaxID=2100421 RepID=A0A6J5MX46_9CAUD|nr:hypothetical protein UFOVP294_36 [uncultured Caudovirales phage]CAB4150531.1 hypothetical protein UFOVP566_49 [uncultured Caudovirales phage]